MKSARSALDFFPGTDGISSILGGVSAGAAAGLSGSVARVPKKRPPGPPRPGSKWDYGYPGDGPDLEDAPKGPIGLPFPGQRSFEFTCGRSGSDPRKCKTKGSKPKTQAKIGVEGTVVETRGQTDPVLKRSGESRSTLSLTSDLRLTGKGKAESKRKFGFGINGEAGRKVDYSVSVDTDRADDIAGGDSPPPNPVDPRSLEKGDSVTLGREIYTGRSGEGTYKLLRGQIGRQEGDRVSAGVTRTSKRRVRIQVGDEEVVRDSSELGLGTDDASIAFGESEERAKGRQRAVTLDIGTRKGWEAYQRFAHTGKLPEARSKEAKEVSNTDLERWKETAGLKIKTPLFKFDSSHQFADGSETTTRYRNGRSRHTYTDRFDEVTYAWSASQKPNGKAGNRSYALALRGAEDEVVERFLSRRNDHRPVDGDQDLYITFTERELLTLRQKAIDEIAEQGGVSPAKVKADYADNGELDQVGTYLREELMGVAPSDKPAEILEGLTSRFGRSDHALTNLELLETVGTGELYNDDLLPDAAGSVEVVRPTTDD